MQQATGTRVLPRDRSAARLWSVHAAAPWLAIVSVVAAATFVALMLLGSVPSVSAQVPTQLDGKTIAPVFPDGEPDPPSITATAAILIDADSGQILFSHNANARLPVASTTKIMTAVIVLETLDLDTKVTVSANAVGTIGSKAALEAGEILTVKQLLSAMLVVSGNDAAVALAETTAGTVQAFVERMNQKAKALGLSNTHFVNPCGLNNAKHFSSAKDLATLTRYAMQNPVFRRIVGTRLFDLPTLHEDSPRKFDNQNELLHKFAWATGVKTGSTPYAKYCLVASGTIDGVSLIGVILGAQEDDVRWKEAEALLDYGFSLYPRTVLVDTGELVAELPTPDVLKRQVRLVAEESLTVSLFKKDVITSHVRIDRDVALPVRAGEVYGTLEFTLNGTSIDSVNLVAAEPIDKASIEMILQFWQESWPPELQLRDH